MSFTPLAPGIPHVFVAAQAPDGEYHPLARAFRPVHLAALLVRLHAAALAAAAGVPTARPWLALLDGAARSLASLAPRLLWPATDTGANRSSPAVVALWRRAELAIACRESGEGPPGIHDTGGGSVDAELDRDDHERWVSA